MKINLQIVNLLFIGILFSAPVEINTAQRVAAHIYAERSNTGTFDGFNPVSIDVLDDNLIYIFQFEPQGFIMVSGNDKVQPLLAYSFESQFILEDMPSNLSWILDSYKQMVKDIVRLDNSSTSEVHPDWEKYYYGKDLKVHNRDMRGPLLESKWNQSGSWNDYGPPSDNSCEGDQAPSGCVAVSMSAIMHYWKYPTTGQGSNSCYCGGYGTQYANFSDAFYDYDAMGAAESGSEAASFLVWHAGVAVNMDYDCPGSGAQVSGGFPSAQYALENNFLYKDNIYASYRSSYSDSQWMNFLVTEIDNNRPMIYVGYNDEGGHAWNCDGYDDELFHMNWGWGGQSDGWFTVTENDDPDGWGSGSHILRNIEPESLNRPNLRLTEYSVNEISGDGDNVINPGETFELIFELENPEPWAAATSIEILLTSEAEGIVIDESTSTIISSQTLQPGDLFSNASVPFVIEVDENAELGDRNFSLLVMGVGIEGAEDNFYFNEYELEVEVSLNQAGFPVYSASQKPSPLVVDIHNDGIEEIIFGDYNGQVHIYNKDGSELVDGAFPFETGNQIWGAAAAADLDRDGLTDFVVASKSKYLYIFDKNGLKAEYNADKYLLGTPAIGNLDDDEDLEVVVSGYSSGNMVFAVNPDGSDVDGFPVDLGEKVKIGVGLADFNGNGKEDIVVGTDSDKIHVILDDGTNAPGFPVTTGDRVQSAPAIAEIDGELIIFTGCNDDNIYAIDSNGEILFTIPTSDKVLNSPAFLNHNGSTYIFVSDDSGVLYAFDKNGNALSGWPVDAGEVISKSVAFSDMDNDGEAEVIAVTELAGILVYNLDGSQFDGFPLMNEFPFTGSPIVLDMDEDGDLEIMASSVSSLVSIDVKSAGDAEGYWSMYRGNNLRTGLYTQSGGSECGSQTGDVSGDGIINILDLVQVVNYILELSIPMYECAADYNDDGIVNILDLVQIANHILDN
ncbi:MAG: C10 family peptidase [Candidatus Marinimicrobia bacterium]|nr:C10 family peptidase [Candidatus Neomarinimicrobiota bacterium]